MKQKTLEYGAGETGIEKDGETELKSKQMPHGEIP